MDPSRYFKIFRQRFFIEQSNPNFTYFQSEGLLSISYGSSNIDDGLYILNFTNNQFIRDNIESESEQSRVVINFLNQRLEEVKEEVDLNKTQLNKFREDNSSINVDIEINQILDSLSLIDLELKKIEIEITKASNNFTTESKFYQGLIDQKEQLLKQRTNVENQIRELPQSQQKIH